MGVGGPKMRQKYNHLSTGVHTNSPWRNLEENTKANVVINLFILSSKKRHEIYILHGFMLTLPSEY
jgi:hypothetical protein